MTDEPTRIGIAIVKHCGNYLIGFRGANTTLAGKAEFPGGKCEPGESFADCAIRECREETGLSVVPQELLYQTTHTYSHDTVSLEFWRCSLSNADKNHPQHGFRWVPAHELVTLDFPAANAPLLDLLSTQQ